MNRPRISLITALCAIFTLAPTAAEAAPARPLTAAELEVAQGLIGVAAADGVIGLDPSQSFRFDLPAPDGPIDVVCGDQGLVPVVAVLRGGGLLTVAQMSPGQRVVTYGGFEAVTMVDLNGDAKLDVLVTANVCNGANCVQNNYVLATALIATPTGYRSAAAWVSAIPSAVVEGGVRSIRTYAKSRPATLTATEAKGSGAPAR